jgi:hypothetical protein
MSLETTAHAAHLHAARLSTRLGRDRTKTLPALIQPGKKYPLGSFFQAPPMVARRAVFP